jgi:hypothetical protein
MTATERIADIGVRLFKDFMNKVWYPFLTRRLDAQEVTFLNYGYEEDPPMGVPLEASDEPNRYGIQLYHRVATQADLEGKKVLEVSCGHGGGASYLTRTLHPASYTGLDFNPDGVAYCKKTHNLPGLDFVHGNAEDLPFPDESFDAVINVEAFSTPMSAATASFPAGTQHWPSCRCAKCRHGSSTMTWSARSTRTRSGHWSLSGAGCRRSCGRSDAVSPVCQVPEFTAASKMGRPSTGCTASPRTEQRPPAQCQAIA